MVLSTTLCYPRAESDTQGIFVRRRLQEIGKLIPLKVVAPRPWFPMLRPEPCSAAQVSDEFPQVARPRMFYLPGILKQFDANWYARALDSGIETACPGDKIDLIDAHFEWPDAVGAWYVAKRRRIPLVVTLRGKLVSQLKHRARRRRIVEMLRGAAGLIAVSKSLAELAQQAVGGELPIHIIPNGVDTSVFRPVAERSSLTQSLGWSESARYVVSVGHWQRLKGFHRLVDVWPSVRRQAGDARLVLIGGAAGEPGYERRVRDEIDRLDLSEFVTVTGRVAPEIVARMLNAANLFALASESEGWCNALAEALACGCPAVATDVGGNAEVMGHWGLGRLVPPNDDAALAERIAFCLEESWDRAKIAEYGGRRDWSLVGRECAAVIDGILRS